MLSGGVILFLIILIILNEIAPLVSDDYLYSFVFDGKHYYDASFTQRISGWGDIYSSQVAHYMCWGGRVVAHTVAQFFLCYGSGVLWSVANTLCFMLCVYLALRASGAPNKVNCTIYFLALCLYWLLLPAPGDVFFWLCGSCNYQWAACFILLYLVLWQGVSSRHYMVWMMYPLALVAGNSQEALSVGMALALVVFALCNHRKISVHQWLGLLVFIIGVGTNVLAPGNQVRLELRGDYAPGLDNMCIRFALGAYGFAGNVIASPQNWLLPILSFILLCYRLYRKEFEKILFPLAGCLSLLLPVYVGNLGSRATFGGFFFSFVALLPLALSGFNRLGSGWQQALLMLVAAFSLYDMYVAAHFLHRQSSAEQNVFEAACSGEERIAWSAPPKSGCLWERRGYAVGTYLMPGSQSVQNRVMESYLNVRPFGVASREYWKKLPDVTPSAYSSLAENEYCRINPQWLLIRVPDGVFDIYARAYFAPEKGLPLLRRWKRCVTDEFIGNYHAIHLINHGGCTYCLLRCEDKWMDTVDVDEVRLDAFLEHRMERYRFSLPAVKGKLERIHS